MWRTVLTIFQTATKYGENSLRKRQPLLIFVWWTHFIHIYKCFVGYNNPWDSNLERDCSMHCSMQLQYAGNSDMLYPYSTVCYRPSWRIGKRIPVEVNSRGAFLKVSKKTPQSSSKFFLWTKKSFLGQFSKIPGVCTLFLPQGQKKFKNHFLWDF